MPLEIHYDGEGYLVAPEPYAPGSAQHRLWEGIHGEIGDYLPNNLMIGENPFDDPSYYELVYDYIETHFDHDGALLPGVSRDQAEGQLMLVVWEHFPAEDVSDEDINQLSTNISNLINMQRLPAERFASASEAIDRFDRMKGVQGEADRYRAQLSSVGTPSHYEKPQRVSIEPRSRARRGRGGLRY